MLDPKLVDVVARVLQIEPTKINAETSPKNTSAWDSVAHLSLVLELEDAFDVRFPSEEIPALDSVARLQEAVTRIKSAPIG